MGSEMCIRDSVMLKTLEGGLKMLINEILLAFGSEEHYKPHADALFPALLPLYEQMSPDTYGGAILLGVDGVCVISHGSSSAKAMLNGIKVAKEMVDVDIVGRLTAAIAAGR